MADIGESTRMFLIGGAALVNMVGERIYPDELPQGCELPAIVYYHIGGSSDEHLLGVVGLAHSRFQIDCYADTRIMANTVAELVRRRMQPHRGAYGDFVADDISAPGDARTATDQPADGSDRSRYITSNDFIVVHNQATS